MTDRIRRSITLSIEEKKRAKRMEDPFSLVAGGDGPISRAKVLAVREFYLKLADEGRNIEELLPVPEDCVNSDPQNQDPQS